MDKIFCCGDNEDYYRDKRLEEIRRVMGNRRISHKPKGNMLSSCVISAYMDARITHELNRKTPEEGPGFARKKLVRRFLGVERADQRGWMN